MWRAAGQRAKAAHKDWDKRVAAMPADKRADFERRMRGDLPGTLNAAIRQVKETLAKEPKEIATRVACEFALETIIPAVPEMVGGSADLTGSNNTPTKSMKAMSAEVVRGVKGILGEKGFKFLQSRGGDWLLVPGE